MYAALHAANSLLVPVTSKIGCATNPRHQVSTRQRWGSVGWGGGAAACDWQAHETVWRQAPHTSPRAAVLPNQHILGRIQTPVWCDTIRAHFGRTLDTRLVTRLDTRKAIAHAESYTAGCIAQCKGEGSSRQKGRHDGGIKSTPLSASATGCTVLQLGAAAQQQTEVVFTIRASGAAEIGICLCADSSPVYGVHGGEHMRCQQSSLLDTRCLVHAKKNMLEMHKRMHLFI